MKTKPEDNVSLIKNRRVVGFSKNFIAVPNNASISFLTDHAVKSEMLWLSITSIVIWNIIVFRVVSQKKMCSFNM